MQDGGVVGPVGEVAGGQRQDRHAGVLVHPGGGVGHRVAGGPDDHEYGGVGGEFGRGAGGARRVADVVVDGQRQPEGQVAVFVQFFQGQRDAVVLAAALAGLGAGQVGVQADGPAGTGRASGGGGAVRAPQQPGPERGGPGEQQPAAGQRE